MQTKHRFKGINPFIPMGIALGGFVLAFITWEGDYRPFNRWTIGSQIGVVIFVTGFTVFIGQFVAALVYQWIQYFKNKRHGKV